MSLIITQRGKPVAKLVPVDDAPDSYGSMLGSVRYRGDIVAPDADVWEDRE
jgi:antitoxin (DNA-binding transcriptional repressor) of toxin-antitoxin stability system